MKFELSKIFKRKEVQEKILQYGTLLLPLVAIISLHSKILSRFNFKYTDMDQVMMLLGYTEMREGNFHMPRYFGQDYGSMLEAWLSVPFVGVDYNYLLPSVSYGLTILPFLLIPFLFEKGRRLSVLTISLSFFAAMPVEYIMIGGMPRDMVTGIAVASLSFVFLRKERWWALLLASFFLVLGISFNSNTGLLSVPILIWKIVDLGLQKKRELIFLSGGVLGALSIHLLVSAFYASNPNLVVHHSWDYSFVFELMLQGISKMDRHLGQLVPFLHYKGIFYPILFISIIVYGFVKKRKSLAFAGLVGLIIFIASFGINKVHDARPTVFFSYERMFMTLPVLAVFFLSQIDRLRKYTTYLGVSSFFIAMSAISTLDFVIKNEAHEKDVFLVVATTETVEKKCAQVEKMYLENNAEAIIYGPGILPIIWLLDRTCPCISEVDIMVRPEYERKTWDMNTLDQPIYNRFLWYSPDINDSLLNTIGATNFTKLDTIDDFTNVYLIEGENLNPIEFYKKAGFIISNY